VFHVLALEQTVEVGWVAAASGTRNQIAPLVLSQ
jgi:hypothetical protein